MQSGSLIGQNSRSEIIVHEISAGRRSSEKMRAMRVTRHCPNDSDPAKENIVPTGMSVEASTDLPTSWTSAVLDDGSIKKSPLSNGTPSSRIRGFSDNLSEPRKEGVFKLVQALKTSALDRGDTKTALRLDAIEAKVATTKRCSSDCNSKEKPEPQPTSCSDQADYAVHGTFNITKAAACNFTELSRMQEATAVRASQAHIDVVMACPNRIGPSLDTFETVVEEQLSPPCDSPNPAHEITGSAVASTAEGPPSPGVQSLLLQLESCRVDCTNPSDPRTSNPNRSPAAVESLSVAGPWAPSRGLGWEEPATPSYVARSSLEPMSVSDSSFQAADVVFECGPGGPCAAGATLCGLSPPAPDATALVRLSPPCA